MVQSSLNQIPADRLGGRAPVEAFTALPATPPLASFTAQFTVDEMPITEIKALQDAHLRKLAVALDDMHKEVSVTASKRRGQARARRQGKAATKLAKFAQGDFILAAAVVKHPNKLALRWRGPYRVVQVMSDYLVQVQQLVAPFEISLHHASRVKMYVEGGRELTEDLVEQIAFGDESFWKVLVKWLGLEDDEASWEPALNVYADAPVLFRRWTRARAAPDAARAMVPDLEAALGHAL